MEQEFNKHASEVKTYFTLNGQHQVQIDGNRATGISFSQIKMIREKEGKIFYLTTVLNMMISMFF